MRARVYIGGAVRRGVLLLVTGARGSRSLRRPTGSIRRHGGSRADVVCRAARRHLLPVAAFAQWPTPRLSRCLERAPPVQLRATAARDRELAGARRDQHGRRISTRALRTTKTTPTSSTLIRLTAWKMSYSFPARKGVHEVPHLPLKSSYASGQMDGS